MTVEGISTRIRGRPARMSRRMPCREQERRMSAVRCQMMVCSCRCLHVNRLGVPRFDCIAYRNTLILVRRCSPQKNMTPKWLQLVRAVPSNPHIARDALTVAFLVGATRDSLEERAVSPGAGRHELGALIAEFVEQAPPGQVVSISRCGAIRQPVVRLLDAAYSSAARHVVTSESQGRRTLIVEAEFAPSVVLSGSSLADKLFEELGNSICAGKFSYRRGRYDVFNDEERQFIDEATMP